MKQNLMLAGLILFVGVAVVGCGGSGGGSGSVGSNPTSIYGNKFVGPYTVATAAAAVRPGVKPNTATTADTGEAAISVSATGAVTGRFIDEGPSNPGTGSLSGQITLTAGTTASGSVTITSNRNGSTDTYTGVLTLSNGSLTGTLTDSNSIQLNFSAGLAAITPTSSQYAGYYDGTFTYNGGAGTPANALALIIDDNGTVVGYDVNNTASQSTSVLVGTITSTGLLTIGSQGSSSESTGNLSLSNGVLSGTITGNSNTIVVSVTANS